MPHLYECDEGRGQDDWIVAGITWRCCQRKKTSLSSAEVVVVTTVANHGLLSNVTGDYVNLSKGGERV